MEIDKKGHIYVNSHPRSGTTYFVRLLDVRYGFWEGNNNLVTKIWKEHFPQVLLADIPDTLQISIVRDPVDCLSSAAIKDIGDFVQVPRPDKDEFYNFYFKNKVETYNKYLDNLIGTKASVLPVSFESVTDKSLDILKKIDDMTSLVPINSLEDTQERAVNAMKKSNNYNSFHNNYPMFKPPIYKDYKVKIESYRDSVLKETYEKYNYLKSEVLL